MEYLEVIKESLLKKFGKPHLQSISNLPGFDSVMEKLETYFWERHEEIRIMLEEKGVID